jgi:preprotein translocase subunit SecD
MKEELRNGRTLASAVETGFHRAWDSIRDSNFSTLITCAILFYFGSGMIRGFALTLALGVMMSLFTAVVVTRALMRLLLRTGASRVPALFGVSGIELPVDRPSRPSAPSGPTGFLGANP